MYDKDASGEIDLEEMVEIFCLMYAIQVWTCRLAYYGDELQKWADSLNSPWA